MLAEPAEDDDSGTKGGAADKGEGNKMEEEDEQIPDSALAPELQVSFHSRIIGNTDRLSQALCQLIFSTQ